MTTIAIPPPAAPPAQAASPASGNWRPGLTWAVRGQHGEIFAPDAEATGVALALALARDIDTPDARAWLWVQDAAARRLGGRPYLHGLPNGLRHRVIHVAASKPEDALFALEEGLRCGALSFIVGEIAGNPRALDFTASRRLSLMAERHGVPLWLVRLEANRDLGSARMRWAARAAPSRPGHWDPDAPGRAAWDAELFRARGFRPARWILRDAPHRLSAEPVVTASSPDPGDLAGPPGHRPLATG